MNRQGMYEIYYKNGADTETMYLLTSGKPQGKTFIEDFKSHFIETRKADIEREITRNNSRNRKLKVELNQINKYIENPNDEMKDKIEKYAENIVNTIKLD